MPVFEGWTFAVARGASRKSLFQVAGASKIGPDVLDDIERARDIDPADSRVDIAAIERLVDIYAVLGFRNMPRTMLQATCLKRVQ
jgi:hypothetical protein